MPWATFIFILSEPYPYYFYLHTQYQPRGHTGIFQYHKNNAKPLFIVLSIVAAEWLHKYIGYVKILGLQNQ